MQSDRIVTDMAFRPATLSCVGGTDWHAGGNKWHWCRLKSHAWWITVPVLVKTPVNLVQHRIDAVNNIVLKIVKIVKIVKIFKTPMNLVQHRIDAVNHIVLWDNSTCYSWHWSLCNRNGRSKTLMSRDYIYHSIIKHPSKMFLNVEINLVQL